MLLTEHLYTLFLDFEGFMNEKLILLLTFRAFLDLSHQFLKTQDQSDENRCTSAYRSLPGDFGTVKVIYPAYLLSSIKIGKLSPFSSVNRSISERILVICPRALISFRFQLLELASLNFSSLSNLSISFSFINDTH